MTCWRMSAAQFLEARQNFAGLLTPPQLNRFIEEVAGPMLVMADGAVVQKNDTGP